MSGALVSRRLAAPNAQLTGSRNSLHSETHSSSSTPGLMRHRLRTVSVFGSQGMNRSIDVGTEACHANISPSSASRFGDKRERKTSAPSSLHPFRAYIGADLDSPMEEASDETSSSIGRKPSFSVSSKDFPKNSRKLRVLMNQIADSTNGIPLESHRYAMRLYYSAFLGRQLIDWLQKRDTNTQLDTALAIGQALLDFNYIQDLSEGSAPQSSDTPKPEFNEDKPYRPDNISTRPANVLNPKQSFLSPIVLDQPPGRKMTILQTTPLLPSKETTGEEKMVTGILREDDEDFFDGPEWFQDLITTGNNVASVSGGMISGESNGESNDSSKEDSHKSTQPKKDSGATFGQDLPEFQKSATNVDSLNVDGIECPELDKIYLNHQKEYIRRLIKEENVHEKWVDPIIRYCTRIADNVKVEFNSTISNWMDIREHVKIKRIPGGTMEDSRIINGEVFSGRVVRKGMPLSLTKPNLLLISESIGYPRDDKLVSLENLPAQQEEYVKNVINKLKSFQPDLILSESGICHGTQEGLHEAKISVVLRVKAKVLERVERLFDTRTVISLDSTHQAPPPGSCYKYSNQSFIMDDMTRRNYIILEQSDDIKLMKGCTVLLRGGSSDELARVKRVLKRMLLVKQSARYEKAFLLTEYCQIDRFKENTLLYNDCSFSQLTLSPFVTISKLDKPEADENPNKPIVNDCEKPTQHKTKPREDPNLDLNSTICLSGDREFQPKEYKDSSNSDVIVHQGHIKQQKSENSQIISAKLGSLQNDTTPEFITTLLTTDLGSRRVRNMVADFRANNGSRYMNDNAYSPNVKCAKTMCDKNQSDLPPAPEYYKKVEDKKLPIVYSSHSPVSRVSPQYCVKPFIPGMAFYGTGDVPIGAFLEDFCFNDAEKCANRECTSPLRDHIRRFVLENICVTLKVQEAEENMMRCCDSDTIQTWRYCPSCKLVTPILTLNPDAWMLSFAVFFLLLIYEENLTRRGATYDVCKHLLHRDHHICFLKGDMLASFKVSSIELHQLVLPAPRLKMPSKSPTKDQLIKELNSLNMHRQTMFQQLNEKLNKIKSEPHGPSFLSAVTAHLNDAAKDFEQLKKFADGIDNNVRAGTQLNEMRISTMMLKVQLLKTISSWRSKLLTLADAKKKEDKNMSSNASRHPSGSNLSACQQALLIDQVTSNYEISSQSSIESRPDDDPQSNSQNPPPLLCSSSIADVAVTSESKVAKTEKAKSVTKTENFIDITIAQDKINEEHLIQDSVDTAARPSTVVQPQSIQTVVSAPKSKWHSREQSNQFDFQLHSPFPATLHPDLYVKPGVLVDESQPSSIIAYTLASNDYRNFVVDCIAKHPSLESLDTPHVYHVYENSTDLLQDEQLGTVDMPDDGLKKESDDQNRHFKYSFRDESCEFYCKALFANEFECFRESTLSSRTQLLLSLSECSRYNASGGKSGVKFFKTTDDRFLLKELNRTEAKDVTTFVPKYLDYMAKAHYNELFEQFGSSNTLMAKIFGVFDVGYKNQDTGRKSGTMYILMENLTYGRSNITGSYDLKGSRR